MATNIVVPQLGDSVLEATIIKWNKNEGDFVKLGETIVELETEKANFEVAAETTGILKSIKRIAEEDVEVGDIIGEIEASSGADISEKVEEKKAKETEKQPEKKIAIKETKPTEIIEEVKEKEVPEEQEVKVTPVAKNIAKEKEIDLSKVKPSGPGNRITKEDVETYSKQESDDLKIPAPESIPEDLFPSLSKINLNRERRVKMSRRRRTIARRLKEAQETAAILSTFNEIDMSAVMDLRKRRKDDFKEKYGVGLGFSSFFVKATIGALKKFPEINAEIQGEEIVYKDYYDIGMAIGADEGLVVPVLRDADRKSFAEIELEIKEFVNKANEGTLTLDELMGGTFSITNGGVFGSLMSTPIINPPQVGILGLHKIEERPVAVDGDIIIKPMMYTALSYDHRIVDGKEAVQFLVKIKELIEDPETLLIEG
ncbi:MAG: 2-oxoglutarate dehydrogenase complex dihydrolipoyllysine-residue succinyltransferase [Candidatus Dadabacteria bacterium]|nr:2-oxoglutarate dehydrogenase complex dihydrolipoyllysine-residue succinyltransferase [Candidatus Dadabacteria bacterium]NIQ13119.1 2-oxoglutarate dehydrogenase complex dihydrolipoyllysine-residue succinyltransferase [Candidatus Dadabacteria bacterium]